MSKEFNEYDFFTYTIKNNTILSGGYEINSTLLKKQIPLLGMDQFNGLAIPVGLLHLSQNNEKESLEEVFEENPLQEDIYDKLLKLMNESTEKPKKKETKRKTRKFIKKTSRITKKTTK